MIKIVIGGQMDKQKIEKIINQYGNGEVETTIKTDIEGALAVKSGQADYYFGSCATGSGGALAMAIGIIGADKSISISIPGKTLSEEEIRKSVQDGKQAFGFVNTDAEKVIPILMDEILNK